MVRGYEQGTTETAEVEPERRIAPGRTTLTAMLAPLQRKPSAAAMPSGSRELDLAPRDPAGGLPFELRSNLEALAGIAMDDVRVSYNSSLPASMNAHAVASGKDIHLGPGQEQHLPHEAWHVVQQKQGRVAATVQAKGWQYNDDPALELEADVMGARAMALTPDERTHAAPRVVAAPTSSVHQLAPLGPIEHIRNSCYIAAIIHTFAVTASLRNLLDPVANDLGGGPGGPGGPLADLQDLLHRAVNTVDAQALVDANWVAAIMTGLVAVGIVADADAQDVNGVTNALVLQLQNGVGAAAQPDGRPAYSLVVWQSEDIADDLDAQGFDVDTLGNAVHLNRGPANHEDAPDAFSLDDHDGGVVTYHLRSIVNRDVGSYDQSHFVAYGNRAPMGAPDEWHENDDVGPRARPIPSIDGIATDPALIAARRDRLKARGIPDETIDSDEDLQGALAPEPIDVRTDAVMYVYERAGAAAVAAVDGGTRTLTGGNPPDTSGFRLAYYQMLFAGRAQLSFDTRAALLAVFEEGEGFGDEAATLRDEIVQGLAQGLGSAIAAYLGLTGQGATTPAVPSAPADESVEVGQAAQELIGAGAELLKGPGTRSFQAKGDVAEKIATELGALVGARDARAIARFTPAQVMLLKGWQQMPLQFPADAEGRKSHVRKKELIEANGAFLRYLDTLLDDDAIQATLEPEASDRLLEIHTQLGADAHASGGSSRVRADATGIPASDDVVIDDEFQLFPPESPSESEVEDDPIDLGEQAELARQQDHFSLFSTGTFGNHNPQPGDSKDISREQLSGLGHSNTTAFVMRGDQFVPRTVGPVLAPQRNQNAHRRRLGRLDRDGSGYDKGVPHDRLDALAGRHQDKYREQPSRFRHNFGRTDRDRRTMRHTLSTALMWTEQSRFLPGEEAPALEQRRRELGRDVDASTPSGGLLKRHRAAIDKTHDHAESQAVRSQLWRVLTERVVALVHAQGESTLDDRTLQLVLNRSNCEGCAGRLVEEAIRFWTELDRTSDEPTGNWRAARDAFRDQARLMVAFSGNYHLDAIARFEEICLALTDAGWIVNVLPRNRVTPELTSQTDTTLGALERLIKARPEQAEQLRRQFIVDERLRKSTPRQFPSLFPPVSSSSKDGGEDPPHQHAASSSDHPEATGAESQAKRLRLMSSEEHARDALAEDDFDVSLHLGPQPIELDADDEPQAPADGPRDRFGLRGGALRKPAPDEDPDAL